MKQAQGTQTRTAAFQSGERVELLATRDLYTRLRPGARGTVTAVDNCGSVHVSWDDGSRLGLVPGEDHLQRVGRA